ETDLVTDGERLRVRVVDTGIGMTPEEMSRAFEAFSQGDHASESTGRFGGVGLGLAISRSLVELQKGRIWAESEGRGRGSTFIIELPLAPSGVECSGRTAGPGAAEPSNVEPDGAARRRVLLVEDHEPTRTAIA